MTDERGADPTETRERAAGAAASEPSSLPPDFARWYDEHRETVYRYVRYRLSGREVAEDITSTVFLKALRALDRYDPSRSSPRTWLLNIARNAVIDHFRRLSRRSSLHVSIDAVPDLVSHSPSQEERMLHRERIQELLNATRTLGATDQEVLSLRYGAELENPEIAEVLGISPNAVAVRIHRALKRLRRAVEEGGDP